MKEKHISVTVEQHKQLQQLAKESGRTMRGMLAKLLHDYKAKNADK